MGGPLGATFFIGGRGPPPAPRRPALTTIKINDNNIHGEKMLKDAPRVLA